MYTEARAPSSRNSDLSVHNRRITYLLGPCPGGPRHDGIDYANSRNRPSWPKPPRNYASTPSDSVSSILVSLCLFLSPSFSLFRPSLFFFFSISSFIRTPCALLSSFFKLIHPLSSFLEYQRLLLFYRIVGLSPSAPFLFSCPPSYPYPLAYYIIRITIICFETASTAHQSE